LTLLAIATSLDKDVTHVSITLSDEFTQRKQFKYNNTADYSSRNSTTPSWSQQSTKFQTPAEDFTLQFLDQELIS